MIYFSDDYYEIYELNNGHFGIRCKLIVNYIQGHEKAFE